MVAVNLFASLLTTNNLCISICLNIIAHLYYNGEFRVMFYAITFCRISGMRSPLRGGGRVHVPLGCSSVPSNFVFLHSLLPNMSLFPSKFGLSSSVPLK